MKILPVKKGEAFLLEDRLNRRYVAETDVAEGFLIYGENPVYFTDMRYYPAAESKIIKAGCKAAVLRGEEDIKNALRLRGVKTLRVDFSRTTVSRYNEYLKWADEIKDCSALLSGMREIKTEKEREDIAAACKIAEIAVNKTFGFIKRGVTEREVKDFLEREMLNSGAEDVAFDTIVAFGENSAVPHHETGERKLKLNDAVLIDTGCKVNGYCSDITRTAFFGEPNAEFLNAYDAVLQANLLAEAEIFAGISGAQADAIARNALDKRGYGENFTHSLGHGVGLEIHETPYLSPKKDGVLKENSVFTVEPGVYFSGKFGIRIEDTCVMRGGKAERLFSDSKKPLIIKAEK